MHSCFKAGDGMPQMITGNDPITRNALYKVTGVVRDVKTNFRVIIDERANGQSGYYLMYNDFKDDRDDEHHWGVIDVRDQAIKELLIASDAQSERPR